MPILQYIQRANHEGVHLQLIKYQMPIISQFQKTNKQTKAKIRIALPVMMKGKKKASAGHGLIVLYE